MPATQFPGGTTGYAARVPLADATYDAYEREALRQNKSIETVLAQQLTRFKDITPTTDRVLVLDGPTRERLESLLGDIPDTQALLDRAAALATVTIGGVKVAFSKAEHEEIKRRAQKNGITLAEEWQRSVDQIKPLILAGVRS